MAISLSIKWRKNIVNTFYYKTAYKQNTFHYYFHSFESMFTRRWKKRAQTKTIFHRSKKRKRKKKKNVDSIRRGHLISSFPPFHFIRLSFSICCLLNKKKISRFFFRFASSSMGFLTFFLQTKPLDKYL